MIINGLGSDLSNREPFHFLSRTMPEAASLLIEYRDLFLGGDLAGPVLDLACGDGRNGIYLARLGIQVILCDRAQEGLDKARDLAMQWSAKVGIWQVDLELPGVNPLPEDAYGGMLVFRYLHRPLIPCIGKALKEGGVLLYETYTEEQRQYGKPRSPGYLLKRGELRSWFRDWDILHYFEGIKEAPRRAVAQIVCRKPFFHSGCANP